MKRVKKLEKALIHEIEAVSRLPLNNRTYRYRKELINILQKTREFHFPKRKETIQ